MTISDQERVEIMMLLSGMRAQIDVLLRKFAEPKPAETPEPVTTTPRQKPPTFGGGKNGS